jgi:serine/arginine repetitive matrix protein 2
VITNFIFLGQATSPTPRPVANVTATNSAPSVAPSADVATQQPAQPGPPSSTSATSVLPVKGLPSPPAPVVVPQSGRETPFKAEDQQSGSIPSPTAAVVNFSTANSAPDSRAPSESDHVQKDASQPISQGQNPSPRVRALAEALFGAGEPSPINNNVASPLSASLSNSPSAPGTPFVPLVKQPTSGSNLEADIGRKAAAATAALKNSSEVSGLGLRRKPTKKIQTSQISVPQLLSASMSVDAIHLASPVSTLAPTSPASHQDASSGSNSRASGRGILGRLRSLRKSQQSGVLEPIDTASSTLARQDSVSPTGQTIVYQPNTVHKPEIQSVPPHGAIPSSPPQHQWPQSAGPTQTMPAVSPPATSGGLKGFMTRLRQAKGSARKEEAKGSPATPSVALQNAAITASPHLQQRDSRRSPSSQSPLSQRMRGATSGGALPPIIATPLEEEEAVAAFRQAGKSLGLEDELINGFLLQRSNSTTRAGSSGAPRHEGANSPPVASLPPSRHPSTRAKPMEGNVNPRARVMRDGVDPLSTVVRRTIIVPSTSASAFSASQTILAEGRNASPALRKPSTRRRPQSASSQHSTKLPIMDRVPTPPPPRGGRRFSEDSRPPMPSAPGTNSHQPTPMNQSSHAGGYVHGYKGCPIISC